MKTLPALFAGPACGLLLYAALRLSNPSGDIENAWVTHFRGEGLETRIRSTSTEVDRRIAVDDWRGQLGDAKFAGRLVTLEVQRTPVQIVELGEADAARELAKRPRNKRFAVLREGRFLCILTADRRGAAPEEAEALRRSVEDAFRSRARKLP
jgi:hypothetical protein